MCVQKETDAELIASALSTNKCVYIFILECFFEMFILKC
jgi:hypothetical protein